MGMYDSFTPSLPLPCPECGTLLERFQGKDGPCAQLVWTQGERFPKMDPHVDEAWHLSAADLAKRALPAQFCFYTSCPHCNCWSIFTGFCDDGVWRESAWGKHTTTAASAIPAVSVAPDWRQCSACAGAWHYRDIFPLTGCPTCKVLTRLDGTP
jgi:hypothetical protein